MSKKGPVSQSEYKNAAATTSEVCERSGAKLVEIARHLGNSPDFSPCTIENMRAVLNDIDTLRTALKGMVEVSVRRGCTHFDEQKERLLDGTLRLNRRSTDMAAE